MTNWNEICQLCYRERITLSELSRLTGIERTRVHRLRHAQYLAEVITVREMYAIVSRFPDFMIDY